MTHATRKEKIRHLLLIVLLLVGFTCPDICAADKKSIEDVLLKTIEEKGIKEAIAQYRQLKEKDFETYQFEECQLNNLGRKLLKKESKLAGRKFTGCAETSAFKNYNSCECRKKRPF